MDKLPSEKQRSQESVRKSREKKKRMIEDKQKEKDVVEEEVDQLSQQLAYEEEKKAFLNRVKDKNINELTSAEQETLQTYLSQ